jgi:hypothetical protein
MLLEILSLESHGLNTLFSFFDWIIDVLCLKSFMILTNISLLILYIRWRGEQMLPLNSIQFRQYSNFTLLIRKVGDKDGGIYTCQV